jgi:hypothetical protein
MNGRLMPTVTIGPLFGLRVSFEKLFWPSYLALAIVAALLAHWLVRTPAGTSVVAGVLSALLVLVSEWLHQMGHALAAQLVGHPMVGIRFFNLFSASEYPADEPALPPPTHVRRALGGFWINVVIGLLLLPVALRLWPQGREILPPAISLLGWLAGFGVAVNLVVLGLGALLPLKIPGGGLNDGGTLLRYWLETRANPDPREH